MNVWYHHPTIFKRRFALRLAGLLSLCVALTTTLLFANVSHATTGINQTLSFQGRLLSSSGAVVPDGHYNIQFKIYQDGDGTTAGDSGGTLKWTESYINNGGMSGVQVTNGFFSVNLGSLNPFGTQVDWNQDTLWLSMNVAGSSASCTTFGTSPCTADGEMLPMKRITSTPYALNSGMLGGKTADNFLQLAQGVQEDASNNTSSIYVNKTGSGGNFLQLQNASTDVLTVTNDGNLTFGGTTEHTITVGDAPDGSAGQRLTIKGGNGGGDSLNGGELLLQGGDAADGSNANGGDITLDGGTGKDGGVNGSIAIGTARARFISIGSTWAAISQDIYIGANDTSGSYSNVTIGSGGDATGGTTAVQSKDDTTVSTNGTQRARFSSSSDTLYVGNADASGQAATANTFTIQGTSSTSSNVQGGGLTVQAGSATNGDANGGNLTLSAGSGSGTGASGLVVISTPTFQTAGQQNCSSNCTITQANLDSNGAVIINATTPGLTVTMNDPTITTAGRIVYVMAAGGSDDFTLSANSGSSKVTVHQNSAATMIWNGSDWSVAGSSNSTTLQDVYNNTLQSTGSTGVTLGNGGSSSGLVIHDSSTDPVSGSLLTVQDSLDDALFSINSNADTNVSNVQVGSNGGGDSTTLFTLDKASSAPTITNSDLLGSMYYDTTIGKVQCYEADGWGACGSSPDNIITISPEYTNAVMHGTGVGSMTSDFCSDSLGINDGSSGQPSICASGQTYNFYKWTSPQTTSQTYSIYVTYKLPSTFKSFSAGSTTLKARTDDGSSGGSASVQYTVMRNTGSNLTTCGSAVAVSSGTQTTWQTGTASSTSDPANCSFAAGDSIVLKIDVAANKNAVAYVSDLGFTFSNE